ncbi:subtilisin-like serine protease PR1C [Cordyceps javanica]|uniref:Subtilisin-like serine protease PR1C n=1 Tax=Cordyceps javanica TaxID=43265 RepID=A0A545UUU3_9HYPO|nr:subtilisin-like serine protease PR1C [Cordyceps javanica]
MIYPPWLAIVWLGAAVVTPALATENVAEPSNNNAAGAFILECETKERTSLVSQFKGITESWPVQKVIQVPDSPNGKEDGLGKNSTAPPAIGKRHHRLGRRIRNDGIEAPWNHVMAHVDKLYEEGYTGTGIKIAVVDTGNRLTTSILSDPMDWHGYGTKVLGILAGYDKDKGFVGAALNATIMAYRVLDCAAEGSEDDMIAGWLKAKEDGAQIIVSGVPCVAALGNTQDDGLFYAANPSTGRGVTSVNSFRRAYLALEHRGEYSTGDTTSGPVDFVFEPGRSLDGWDGEPRPVHDVDADFGDEPDDDLAGAEQVPISINAFTELAENCKLFPGNSSTGGFAQDLVGRIALIRQTPQTKECHFYDRVRNAAARGAEHILAWQTNPRYVEIRRGDAMGRPIKAIGITGAQVGRAMARALASGQPVTARRIGRVRIETGDIAALLAHGPTWELDVKPAIGAPGDLVPQGGGLLRAWEVAHATTLVEPAALAFNDTDNRPGSIGLRITNTAKAEVTYRLSNLAATTLYTFWSGSIRLSTGEAVDETADIKLSQTSVTGSDGQNLTVPYLGMGGSLRSATILDPDSPLRSVPDLDSFELVLGSPLVRVDIVPLDICSIPAPANATSVGTRGLAGLAREAAATEPDLSRACVPDSIVIEFAGIRSIGQLPGYPKHYVKAGEKFLLDWRGAFAPEQYAPPGRY